MNINRLNKKLKKRFGDTVSVKEQDGSIVLSGELPDWKSTREAGTLCAKKYSRTHVVNDITCGEPLSEPRLPELSDSALEGVRCDVLIVGAGVVGCAAARELSRYELNVLLVDKEYDVALHASSRNDGMVHPGLDLRRGTQKYKYNMAGNRLYTKLCEQLEVKFERCGQYIALRRAMLPVGVLSLPYWYALGVGGAAVVGRRKLKKLFPTLSEQVGGALYFKQAGRVCPYSLTIALAENAVDNGVRLSLETAVLDISTSNGNITQVKTNRGTVYPRCVINAAGVFSADIAAMAGDRFFSIHPRKGTDLILDKRAFAFAPGIIAALGGVEKTVHSKGGGLVGTVDKNVLVGPDAQETNLREDFSTDAAQAQAVMRKHAPVLSGTGYFDMITAFSGVRAATYEEDFIVERGRKVHNLVHAAGIQSPGLTAAPAIALELSRLARQVLGSDIQLNKSFNPIRRAIPASRELPLEQRSELIKQNPDFGEIVCRCEQISRAEVCAALHRSVPCVTVDGVKRRVRAGMGRCQGGFCGPLVMKIISSETGVPLWKVRKACEHSEQLFGPSKEVQNG